MYIHIHLCTCTYRMHKYSTCACTYLHHQLFQLIVGEEAWLVVRIWVRVTYNKKDKLTSTQTDVMIGNTYIVHCNMHNMWIHVSMDVLYTWPATPSGWSGFNLTTFFQERTINDSIIINDNGATVVEGRSTRITLLHDPVQLQGRRNQLSWSGPGRPKIVVHVKMII